MGGPLFPSTKKNLSQGLGGNTSPTLDILCPVHVHVFISTNKRGKTLGSESQGIFGQEVGQRKNQKIVSKPASPQNKQKDKQTLRRTCEKAVWLKRRTGGQEGW